MSGVYIPNMPMPKSCRKCGLKMDCDHCESWECYCLPLQKNIGYMDDEPEIPSDKRRDDCPLVYVPDHGRCVDADALMKHEVFIPLDGGHLPVVYAAYVRNAPTILPGEEAKE